MEAVPGHPLKRARGTQETLLYLEESMAPLNHTHSPHFSTSTRPCIPRKSETHVAFLLGLAGFAGSPWVGKVRTSQSWCLLQERCPKR